MRSSDALLLVANTTPGAEATVPGKLFEYLAVGRPILAIAPPALLDRRRAAGYRPAGRWLAGRLLLPSPIARRAAACAYADQARALDGNGPRRSCPSSTDVALAGDLARVFEDATRRF